MSKKYQWLTFASLLLTGLLFYWLYEFRHNIAMLNPQGWVAMEERDLMITATVLMLLVVVPVFIMTIYIVSKFHQKNKNANYTPDWDNSVILEIIWWGFPFIIVVFLSIIAWKTSHELDPFKPLVSDVKPITIQVVALQWKWLFIYPEEGIASINHFQIPEKTPINFEITADAPMNSFWLPSLGGQIYAMPGMRSKLHIIADHVGEFKGASANLSGDGFSGMIFTVTSSKQEDYDKWVQNTQSLNQTLDLDTYQQLARPSEYNPASYYKLGKKDLFDWIVMIPMMKNRETTKE